MFHRIFRPSSVSAAALCAGLLFASAASGQETMSVPVRSPNVQVERDADGYASFTCRDVQWLSQPGEPQIPWQVVTVLLPPDASLELVDVRLEKQTFSLLGSPWTVRPAPPATVRREERSVAFWPEDKRIANGRDTQIYDHDATWPPEDVRLVSTGRLRKWTLAQAAVPLVRYNPASGALRYLVSAELVVNTKRKGIAALTSEERAGLADEIGETMARRLAANFDEQQEVYEQAARAVGDRTGRNGEPGSARSRSSGYVIITTSAIQAASTQLGNFVALKEARGFAVQVVTETDFGGGSGNAAAENIRAWLQGHYVSDGIEYVLLIGNPDPASGDVPMKMLWPRRGATTYPDDQDSPSDYYYADLTGNWDLDGDGYYGEWNGDFGPGGVDRNWEVLVGRIPYYGTIADLDHILGKIITYENTSQSETGWRRYALLPMKETDQHLREYLLGEEIANAILIPKGGWGFHRVYDQAHLLDPPPETMPCTVATVTDVWTGSPFGLVVWATHGLETSAVEVMTSAQAAGLNDSYPAFTFQASCLNAHPETVNNLAYALLRNGAICTVGATRVSFGVSGIRSFAGQATMDGMAADYSAGLVGDQFDSGQALYDIKQRIVPTWDAFWMNYTDFNIYGCPAVGLYSGQPNGMTVTPEAGASFEGDAGGPYAPSSVTYTIGNSSAQAITFSAQRTRGWWLSINGGDGPVTGTLLPGQTANVTIALNGHADALPSGQRQDTLTFVNQTTGVGNGARQVTLQSKLVHGWTAIRPSVAGVAMDAVGNVFVTTDWQYSSVTHIYKFSSSGAELWARTYGSNVTVRGLAVDPSGNVFVTGTFTGTVDLDPTEGEDIYTSGTVFTVRLNADGSYGWANVLSGSMSAYDVGCSSNGDVVVAGSFSGNTDFDPSAGEDWRTGSVFVSRYGGDGSYWWTSTRTGASANAVAVDTQGDILLAGTLGSTVDFDPSANTDYHTSNGQGDVFVTKLQADGTYAWTRTFGGTAYEYGRDVAVDSAGNVFVTGEFFQCIAWGGCLDSGYSVDFDPTSGTDIHVNQGNTDAFITKLGGDGSYRWTRTIGSHPASIFPKAVAVDGAGNPIVAGNFYDAVGVADWPIVVDFDPTCGTDWYGLSPGWLNADGFVSRLGTDGEYYWTGIITGANRDYADDVAVDGVGNVVVAGRFGESSSSAYFGSADLDPTEGEDWYTASSGMRGYITYLPLAAEPAGPQLADKIPSPGSRVGGAASVTVSFSEPVTGISAGDLTVNGSPASGITGSGAGPYEFTGYATPAEGNVNVVLAPGSIEGGGGRLFAGDSWAFTLDLTSPTIGSENPAGGSTIGSLPSVSVTFTESVTGVTPGDLTVNGSPATGVSGNGYGPYVFTGYAPPSCGTVNVAVASGATEDLAGNAFAGDAWSYQLVPASATLHVDADASGPTHDGASWCTAFTDLQVALDIARTSGGIVTEIRVADGTYRPAGSGGSRSAAFALISGVALRGGYAGCGAADPDHRNSAAYVTILSGDLDGNDDSDFVGYEENTYHVVTANACPATTILDGFTITGGNGNISATGTDSAGGVYIVAGNPTITKCVILGNYALYGGGMEIRTGGSPALADCVFQRNRSNSGGAIYVWSSSPTLVRCVFVENSSTLRAGCLRNYNGSAPLLTNCCFVGNSADESGGVMYNSVSSSATMINCTFSGNSAVVNGGALYCDSSSGPTVRNSILWGNMQGGSGTVESAQIFLAGSSATVTYSAVQDADPNDASIPFGGAANGNTDDDPLFVDSDGPDDDPNTYDDNNYRLSPGSPCIDAGDNAAVPPGVTTDLGGNPRFIDDPATADCPYVPDSCGTPPIADMGVFEYQTPVLGDLNCDSVFDVNDVAPLALALVDSAAYQLAYPGCDPLRADLDDSGAADGADIQLFVNALVGD